MIRLQIKEKKMKKEIKYIILQVQHNYLKIIKDTLKNQKAIIIMIT